MSYSMEPSESEMLRIPDYDMWARLTTLCNQSGDGSLSDSSNDSREWTLGDDEFLFAFEGVGLEIIGPHDLGRSPKACSERIRFLRRSAAWRALGDMQRALSSAVDARKPDAKRSTWLRRYMLARKRYLARVRDA